MTPKEKAIELVHKFQDYCSYEWYEGEEGHKENMKQCALIAVDEMINMITSNDVDVWDIDILNYWQEVKQEIEAL